MSSTWSIKRARGGRSHRQRGLTLLESMILLVVMSIVAVAAAIGLQSIAKVPTQTNDILVINSKLVDCLEQMRAEPWDTMNFRATALSAATVTIGSRTYPCAVTVASADADGGGPDDDFRLITATIGSHTMSVYATQP